MAQSISEVMTHDPVCIDTGQPVAEAAKLMREHDIGSVVVTEDESVAGILTDRDITLRAVADGQDPTSCTVGQIATTTAVTLSPEQSVEDALNLVREHDIRRVPVVEDGRPVGIVSLGDLSAQRDAGQALADVSAAAPNN